LRRSLINRLGMIGVTGGLCPEAMLAMVALAELKVGSPVKISLIMFSSPVK
jgi:hypothetical protein